MVVRKPSGWGGRDGGGGNSRNEGRQWFMLDWSESEYRCARAASIMKRIVHTSRPTTPGIVLRVKDGDGQINGWTDSRAPGSCKR